MKITGAGELGGPRPGAEVIERVPSASLSYNCGGEHVGNQACSRKIATGNKDGAKGTKKANAMELPTSEESSGEETPLIRRASNKRRNGLYRPPHPLEQRLWYVPITSLMGDEQTQDPEHHLLQRQASGCPPRRRDWRS